MPIDPNRINQFKQVFSKTPQVNNQMVGAPKLIPNNQPQMISTPTMNTPNPMAPGVQGMGPITSLNSTGTLGGMSFNPQDIIQRIMGAMNPQGQGQPQQGNPLQMWLQNLVQNRGNWFGQ